MVGDQVDLHTPHWHGLTFAHHGASTDEVLLLPGGVATVETVVDSPGTWLLHCHVNDHIVRAMSCKRALQHYIVVQHINRPPPLSR